MNVTDENLVIVRGIIDLHKKDNIEDQIISFGGSPIGVPVYDAYYVGLYLEAPVSKITHIGIVEEIDGSNIEGYKDYYLKAIIKLKEAIDPEHAIRKHEYWHLKDLGINEDKMK